MIENYLDEDQAAAIFYSAAITGLTAEKKASDIFNWTEKSAGIVGDLVKALKGAGGAAGTVITKTPSILGWTAGLGSLVGALGGYGIDALNERISGEDPEDKFNSDMEAYYANKAREREDSEWMDRVRSKRDELRRGFKKMAPETYRAEYMALMKALDEKGKRG